MNAHGLIREFIVSPTPCFLFCNLKWKSTENAGQDRRENEEMAVGSNTVLRFCFSPWFSVHGFVSGFLPLVE